MKLGRCVRPCRFLLVHPRLRAAYLPSLNHSSAASVKRVPYRLQIEAEQEDVRLASLIFIAKGMQIGRSSAGGGAATNYGLPLSKVVVAAGTK